VSVSKCEEKYMDQSIRKLCQVPVSASIEMLGFHGAIRNGFPWNISICRCYRYQDRCRNCGSGMWLLYGFDCPNPYLYQYRYTVNWYRVLYKNRILDGLWTLPLLFKSAISLIFSLFAK
jgi:hypothetical protein